MKQSDKDNGAKLLGGYAIVLILFGLFSTLFGRGCYQSSPYYTGCRCNPLTWNAYDQSRYNQRR